MIEVIVDLDEVPPAFEPDVIPPDREKGVIQVVVLGKERSTALAVESEVRVGKRVEIAAIWDDQKGVEVHQAYDPSAGHPPYVGGEVLVVALKPYSHTDAAKVEACPTLTTVRKHGASRVKVVDVDGATIAQGGDPEAHLVKSDGPGNGFFTKNWRGGTKNQENG